MSRFHHEKLQNNGYQGADSNSDIQRGIRCTREIVTCIYKQMQSHPRNHSSNYESVVFESRNLAAISTASVYTCTCTFGEAKTFLAEARIVNSSAAMKRGSN